MKTIKKFKNGNINIVGYKSTIEEVVSLSDFLVTLCDSGMLDFSYASDVATNTFGGYELYNANTDKMYLLTYDMYQRFVSGQVVKLIGYAYDKSEYEYSDIYTYLN